jgi:hypothetical protein
MMMIMMMMMTMFPHRSFGEFTWTSPNGKTHGQIYLSLADIKQHSNILKV